MMRHSDECPGCKRSLRLCLCTWEQMRRAMEEERNKRAADEFYRRVREGE